MSHTTVLTTPAGLGRATRERRIAVRNSAHPDTECQTSVPSGGIHSAWVRDLSTTGVGLLLERHFPAGSWLTVELEQRGGPSLRLRARVVHALEMPNDSWLHGCAFERDLTDDELAAFVE